MSKEQKQTFVFHNSLIMNTQFKTLATGKVRFKKRLYYEKQTKKGHVPTLFRESEGHGHYKKCLS